jgi:hypothetical protein
MKSNASHVQINVNPVNMPFYKDLMNFLGWTVIYEDPNALGVEDEHKVSLWYMSPLKEGCNDYDQMGMNHLGISVPTQSDVDAMVGFLKDHQIPSLFDTPRHRPDFSSGPDQTYYQVMFESPDHILYEVVYTGPKA